MLSLFCMAAHRIMSGRLAVCGFATAELRCVLGRFAETQSTYVYLRRNFSVCHRENAKLGVFLHKLLDKSKKRHPQQYVYVLPNSAVPSAPKKVQERTRRQRVLNTVFMESLSNIMVTGAISEELKGFAIELTQVRVSADCTHLNIYWVTALQEPGVDKKVAEILHSSAGYLKSELIKNGFIGKAPKITFVRDVTHGRAAEVEQLIDKVCAGLPPDLDHSASRDLQASRSFFGFLAVPPLCGITWLGTASSDLAPFAVEHVDVTECLPRNCSIATICDYLAVSHFKLQHASHPDVQSFDQPIIDNSRSVTSTADGINVQRMDRLFSGLGCSGTGTMFNRCLFFMQEGANTAEESLQAGPYVPPEMKMDIYGLDHAALIRQVLLKTKGQSRIPLEELAPLKPGTHNSEEAQARILSLAEYVRQRKRKSNLQVKAEREAQRNLQNVQLSPSDELLSSSTPDSRVDSDDIYDEDDFCNVSFLKED
ncbi:uncharacterized protein LOC142591292 [Dermacentor variabilis]|uniref:uncharacterized protein LOC142591292 n=1 Tax=Dermacentor variabilis TaxID=34621 RepID=UPI003F5B8560